VLEDLDEELDGGEELGVGAKIRRRSTCPCRSPTSASRRTACSGSSGPSRGARRSVDDGVSASLIYEQVLEREGRPDDALGQGLSGSGGGCGDTDTCVDREAAVSPVEHVLGSPLVQELALEEEGDDPLAEGAAHFLEIDLGDVNEPPLRVEAPLSFCLSQYFPGNTTRVVGKDSRFVYACDYAAIPRKGRMTDEQIFGDLRR